MPKWNKTRYEEETVEAFDGIISVVEAADRDERFRTALLNELSDIAKAISNLDAGEGFKVDRG